MKIYSDRQILDFEFRVKVIKEIQESENVQRKLEALKRYDIYKDNTKKWVIEKLKNEGLHDATIELMANRSANVSICKKVINKMSRAYLGGVSRETDSEAQKLQLDELARSLNFNNSQKKADRFLNLYKNTAEAVLPQLDEDLYSQTGEKKYTLKVKVFSPWQYDVLECAQDRELAKVVILSDYVERFQKSLPYVMNQRHSNMQSAYGDGHDQTIANSPEDANVDKSREFIWWSDNYHFTTDAKGRIIPEKSPDDLLNPIGMIPIVTISDDQDGQFWSRGGEDLIEGSILVNTLLTDMFSIAYMQGWGQMVITGSDALPNSFQTGPHRALLLKYNKDEDAKPEVSIASANPPLDSWMKAIEQYVALLLSTNNLAPSNIAMRLDANTFPSGIAMMIEQSESTDNVQDRQEMFKHVERKLWKIALKWLDVLGVNLDAQFQEIGSVDPDMAINIKFHAVRPPVSEQDQLNILKLRKELGLDTMMDLMLKDNPDMTQEEAEQKLLKIMEEKMGMMRKMMQNGMMGEMDGNQETGVQVQS